MAVTRVGQPPPRRKGGSSPPRARRPAAASPAIHLLPYIRGHFGYSCLSRCAPAGERLGRLGSSRLGRLGCLWPAAYLCVREFCVAPPARHPWRHPGSHPRPGARRLLRGRRHRCARRQQQRPHSRDMAPPCPHLAPQCRVSAAHRSGRCAGARGTSPASWSGLASMPRSRSSTTRARSTWWCTGSSPHRSSSPAASSRKKWRPPFGGGTGRRHTCRAWYAWTSAAAVATKGEGDTSGGGATRGGPLRRRLICS